MANVARAEVNLTNMWHSRLGHMSLKNMNVLVKEGYLSPKEVNTLDFCESCVLGKSHKQPYQKSKFRAKEVLEYAHSDLWGSPANPESLSGCRYFLTIIDDFSRKVWIRFLKTKDEVFGNFREWKHLVENQTGKKLKCLRTDNGLEFCNIQMDGLCKEAGIQRHRTCVYTPQQNGVAERMNRTIADKVRSMLAETGLEKVFWAETASTAVYLINRTPNASLNFKIPQEMWTGNKIDLSYLRRFGCVAYVHTTQDKLSPRASKGYFMGYPQGTKGYRVWLPDEGRCTVSRHVVFNEEIVYKDRLKMKQKKDKRVTFEIGLNKEPDTASTRTGSSSQDGAQSNDNMSIGSGGDQSDQESDHNGRVSGSGTNSSNEEDQADDVLEEEDPDLSEYLLARDRERREVKVPSRYEGYDCSAYAMMAAESIQIDEPRTVAEAKRSKYWKQWKQAMIEEMESLDKNHTWDLVDKPLRQKLVGCKWIFKLKEGIPGVEAPRFKARLVAKGFTQVEGVDYNEIFAPVVKHVSIRIMLSAVVNHDMELEQLDVKTAFLHGELDEVIYMTQPEEFVENGREEDVCLLKKSLYGLKQSPRQWNLRFDRFMKEQGFRRSDFDPCVYQRGSDISNVIYLLIYVDDMLVTSKDMKAIQVLKKRLSQEFEMKDMGPASRILGMDIIRDRQKGTLKLSQSRYLKNVINLFNMSEARPVVTPVNSQLKLRSLTAEERITEAKEMDNVPYASAVGSLMYAMIGTRPDLAFPICLVSRFMANPSRKHWIAVKWILKYLVGAAELSLNFIKSDRFEVEGYCDSDYATDLDRRRSVSGYVFKVGGNTVSWRSSLQSVVALSTTEAEYMALNEAAKEGLWVSRFCKELGFKSENFKLFCDSQSAIHLAKNAVFHDRTKHIDTKWHFIRDIREEGLVDIQKIHTKSNPADMLTKAVPGHTVEDGRVQLGILP